MLNAALWRKAIGEAKWLLAALALLLFSFAWVRVWIVTLLETDRFARVIQPLWDKWSQFSPVALEHLLSYSGRVAMTFVEPIVVFTIAAWAIGRGSDAVSGELGRGSMEMLLAQPLRRSHVLAVQGVVTVGGAGLLAAACWAGVWAGVATNTVPEQKPVPLITLPLGFELPNPFKEAETIRVPMRSKVEPAALVPAAFNLFSLGLCLAGIATLFSACDRYRWRTIGLATAVFVVQFIIKGFALATPSLHWLKKTTFFTAFEPQAYVAVAVDRPADTWAWLLLDSTGGVLDLGPLGYNAILLGIGLACYLAAGVIFAKRDLPAPL